MWQVTESMCNSAAERGFTLLEVMVALAIFAVLAGAASMAMQLVLQQSHQLRERMYGSWIADNHLTEMTLLPTPGPGQRVLTIDFAQGRWHLEERRRRRHALLEVEVLVMRVPSGPAVYQAKRWLEISNETQ